jgi:hypothetical protein
MSARLLKAVAGALVLGSWVHAAGHATPTARLTGVSTKTEGLGTTVVIETTEPVVYVAAQPDPLTLPSTCATSRLARCGPVPPAWSPSGDRAGQGDDGAAWRVDAPAKPRRPSAAD